MKIKACKGCVYYYPYKKNGRELHYCAKWDIKRDITEKVCDK